MSYVKQINVMRKATVILVETSERLNDPLNSKREILREINPSKSEIHANRQQNPLGC
jgi:hypothetical protein